MLPLPHSGSPVPFVPLTPLGSQSPSQSHSHSQPHSQSHSHSQSRPQPPHSQSQPPQPQEDPPTERKSSLSSTHTGETDETDGTDEGTMTTMTTGTTGSTGKTWERILTPVLGGVSGLTWEGGGIDGDGDGDDGDKGGNEGLDRSSFSQSPHPHPHPHLHPQSHSHSHSQSHSGEIMTTLSPDHNDHNDHNRGSPLRRLGLERAASWATQSQFQFQSQSQSQSQIQSTLSCTLKSGSEISPVESSSGKRDRTRAVPGLGKEWLALALAPFPLPTPTPTPTPGSGSTAGPGSTRQTRPGYARARTGIQLSSPQVKGQTSSLPGRAPRFRRSVSFCPGFGVGVGVGCCKDKDKDTTTTTTPMMPMMKSHPYLIPGRKRNVSSFSHSYTLNDSHNQKEEQGFSLGSPLLLTTTLPFSLRTTGTEGGQAQVPEGSEGDSYFPPMAAVGSNQDTPRQGSECSTPSSSKTRRGLTRPVRPRAERGVSWTGSVGSRGEGGRARKGIRAGLREAKGEGEGKGDEYMVGMEGWMLRSPFDPPGPTLGMGTYEKLNPGSLMTGCSSDETETETESEGERSGTPGTGMSENDRGLWEEGKRVVCDDGLECFVTRNMYGMEVRLMDQAYSTTVYITTNNDLHIAGEKSHMEEYKRVVRLPLTADMDKMKATLSEGLLSIHIPRLERAVCKAEYKCLGSMSSISEHC